MPNQTPDGAVGSQGRFAQLIEQQPRQYTEKLFDPECALQFHDIATAVTQCPARQGGKFALVIIYIRYTCD
jgi:hypothetical protein